MSDKRLAPPTSVRRFLKTNATTLAGVGGYVIALGVAFASVGVMNAERGAGAMSRYGNTVAEDLAHHAVDPLLRRDRIQLGLLTNRVAARPEVHRIEIRTVDERLFVVAGSATTATSPTYTEPIAVEDTVAGDVTVTLNARTFALPVTEILYESWQFALAGLALTVFVFHFASRLGSPRTRRRGPGAPPDALPRAFVVAANLPLRAVSWSGERERLLARALAIGRRIANLYAGHVAALPGSGIVLVFPVSGPGGDRCFEVVCAALLTRRLLSANGTIAVETDGNAESARNIDGNATDAFRYGVDLAQTGVAIQGDTVKASAVSDVLLLASLAGASELVLGQAAFETLDRPERVEIEQLRNPATEALSTGVAMPCGKVRGVTGEYDALLARQAEVIAMAAAVPS